MHATKYRYKLHYRSMKYKKKIKVYATKQTKQQNQGSCDLILSIGSPRQGRRGGGDQGFE